MRENMQNIPQPGQIYRHYNGNLYRIVTLAEHTETGESLVIYQALSGEYKVYAGPLSMFMERVDKEKYPDAAAEFCFTLQKELIEAPASITEPAQAGKDVRPGEEPAHAEKAVRQGAESAHAEKAVGQEEELSKEAPDARTDIAAGVAAADAGFVKAVENPAPEQTADCPEEEINLNPLVLEFLDADTCERRLNILSALRDCVTDDMINIMAITVGVEIKEGDIESRYDDLRSCLLTFGKYESNRLR